MSDELKERLESLEETVRQLAESVKTLTRTRTEQTREREEALHQTTVKCPRAAELYQQQEAKGIPGALTYYGFYETGDNGASYNGYFWETEARDAGDLLKQDDEKAARVLRALGNKQRLTLLKSILKQPGTANELVERLRMGSTGQFYHHLKVLQLADMVEQNDKGQYEFKGHRVQALIMLLAGVWDAADDRYSKGSWDGL